MITPKTIGQFLLGNREAIEKIAQSKCVPLACLFIISAGLARNYDHHILTEEFAWIGGPLAMSLFSSFFIFAFIKAFGRVPTGSNFGAFFRCFIMTAPLAWLYGIPVEDFTGALPATVFNFTILLIVSFWRVVLMVKVTHVLFGFSLPRAFALVAIPASVEMFVATLVKHIDIVGIMGGMRLTEADEFLLSATSAVTTGSVVLFIIALIVGPFCSRGDVKAREPKKEKLTVSHRSWGFAILICAFWIAMAIKPQQRLENLETLRSFIESQKYQEATEFATEITRDGFPPHRRVTREISSWRQPPAATHLANYSQWPDWIREEFTEDLNYWLKGGRRGSPLDQESIKEAYLDLKDAPYLDELIEEFTPGIELEDAP